MGIIESIFTFLAEIIDGFIGIFTTLFSNSGILAVFYNVTDGITFLGALLLIGIGYTMVRWAFSFVRRLIQMRG